MKNFPFLDVTSRLILTGVISDFKTGKNKLTLMIDKANHIGGEEVTLPLQEKKFFSIY